MLPQSESEDFVPALEALSSRIRENSSKLSWYIQSQDHLDASLYVNRETPKPPRHRDAQGWRHQLKQDALDLFRLASGPEEYIVHLSMNHQYTTCLRWLSHFGIFGIIPHEGSVSYHNISVVASVSESHLKSVCRMAMTMGLLCEPQPDRVAHTATSLLLATNQDFAAWGRCVSEYMYASSSHLPQASERSFRGGKPEHSAYNAAYGTEVTFPDALRRNPKIARDFGGFLRATQRIYANDVQHVLDGFDWGSLSNAKVVDIGSSSAQMSIRLCEAFDRLQLVVHSQARSSAQIKAELEVAPSQIASRIAIEVNEGPMLKYGGAADVFVLRHMLHHMSEEAAVGLLGALAACLSPGGTILIVDLVLPQPGAVGTYEEGLIRTRDLIHKELSNGETRYREDWERLVQKAGKGLSIAKVTSPVGSDLSLLEVRVA
ncbi:O-methyltransferase bik3 [Lasiodiplodia theobromae]|uniref:O-methyltransferase bik3 n=1 Tax=Lasiodiplodia theobromae TaxID=45133 RepID=A0A5N5DMJ6_9PEZI|nr:O-methyltransferase bik3 [Lasiodiplodia theobromae]